jgi:hypothetical protein
VWLLQLTPRCHRIRQQFFTDLRRQLYTRADDTRFYNDLQGALVGLKSQLAENIVAVDFLKDQLFLVTCDDPGPLVTMRLVLPLLRQRLDKLADAYVAKQAQQAEEELLSAV